MQSKREVSPGKAKVPQKGSSKSLEKLSAKRGEEALEICCSPFSYRWGLLAQLVAFILVIDTSGVESGAGPRSSCAAAKCLPRVDACQAYTAGERIVCALC